MMGFSRLSWASFLAVWGAWAVSATPSVNIGMKAAFPAAPYLLELLRSETAAGENSTCYFPLLDRIAAGNFKAATTEAELYQLFTGALKDDGHITNPESLSTFNLALSLRTAAPRVEAHYQYYATAVDPLVGEVKDCPNWVLLDGQQYCTPSLGSPNKQLSALTSRSLPFDRVAGLGKEAVLFADPLSPGFGDFHRALAAASEKGELSYRLRYRRDEAAPREPLPVSGYGVELALKRTDYIVIDDREAAQDSSQKPLDAEDVLNKEEEVTDLKPLSTSELTSLGVKAASFILQSDEPLKTLVKLSQDFPRFSASIAAHEVDQKFIKEHEHNRALGGREGINYLWINGRQLTERQIEPFGLIETVRSERKLIDNVRDLGFDGKQAVSLLGHPAISASKLGDEIRRFDWTDQAEMGKVIIWMNDLENDKAYIDYPKTLAVLLQRTYPGQLPQIGRNIFHLVLPVDFTEAEDLTLITQMAGFLRRGIPVRVGLVPSFTTDDAMSQAKVAYHLMENYGIDALLAYLKFVREESSASASENALKAAVSGFHGESDEAPMTLTQIFEDASYTERITLAMHWSLRLNAKSAPRPAFANGIVVRRDQNWMHTMSMKLMEDLQFLQQAVYHGAIDDDAWVPGLFLENAASNRNPYISPEDETGLRVLDVNKIYADHTLLYSRVPVLESSSEAAKGSWGVLAVIADFTSLDGRLLLLSALKFKRNDGFGVRLEIIHNPTSTSGATKVNSILKEAETKLVDIETLDELTNLLERSSSTVDEEPAMEGALQRFLKFADVNPGEQVLLFNGRVVGPIAEDVPFHDEDFQQLLESEHQSRIEPVYAALDDLGLSDKLSGPVSAAKISSLIALSTIPDLPEGIFESAPSARSSMYDTWESERTTLETGNPETASVHIVGLLNPLSEQGQRWAPILNVLSDLDGVYVKLFINPKTELSELPVKRFFRYVLESKPSFDEAGKVEVLNATFHGLPSEALMTAGMDVPPAWLVSSKVSVYDLDNIKLSSIKGDLEALYELEHILIEGHSREGNKAPPRGAQLVLATDKDPLLTDTIVMANLGYFQFKANPGFYHLHLKEGRSEEIYTIESVGAKGWKPVPGDEGIELALMDFKGTTLYPRLNRKPGMAKVDVLEESGDAEDDSLVSKGLKFAGGLFGGGRKNAMAAAEHAEINIFSVASGHLYERMLNIMMVSVMRNTKHTVKFWFIEQFLSPSFKEFIPYMAAEYGFQYEMVTFKWPHWLRQQKEKQREIWGYKILFLDVLFPLSLDKVIFVDADQVVRTDMIDLVNHDLQGAPYGFTPMCDSRVEMEGFRFWKQGYWANYLRGLPYHISALYVVDLRRFRELAAGDRLRQQYHSLSADPNSLSNLDQDLPNNMQFQIPIHSLPQDWLWCETWCSDESLATARTIDLCNNPETKEPKLDRARRQVPEWTTYDDEIAALDRRRREQNKGPGVVEDMGNETARLDSVNTKSRRFEEEPVHTIDEL